MHRPGAIRVYHRAMLKRRALWLLAMSLSAAACGGGSGGKTGVAGAGGGAAGSTTTGAAGASTTGGGGAGSPGTAGATSGGAGASGGTTGSAGSTGAAGTTTGVGGTTGAAGSNVGSSDGGAGASGAAGSGGTITDAAAGPSFLPAGYKGTPFKLLTIPGRINACDYDRGGANVAWCHDPGNCANGTVTGDYPAGAPVYRPPIPANAKLCSGAACDDNVGVCRMNPSKPDLTAPNVHAPADDTYLCYSYMGNGEWTKYTVVVEQAGTYSVGGFMAVPQGGGVNISFSGTPAITTGNLTLAVTNPSMCGGGEYYHCWAQRDNLATVTFPQAGTYLMTITQTGRFNADNFTFTKM
jgi:hypothetical protein